MNNLNELTECLDKMISKQKEKKARTFVARYKGKNLITKSGKSSWKAVNHAKAAILLHFSYLESAYVYNHEYDTSKSYQLRDWNKFSSEEREKRQEEFRKKLWELIEIVELE
jgi:hypothetical protein